MVKGAKVSESIRLGTILMLTGGFLDAYSYLVRGGVFATAETGNIALMGINLAQGNWERAIHYLIPITSYVCGLFTAERLKEAVGDHLRFHWKEVVLLLELLLVLAVGFVPQRLSAAANCMIGFASAMQVETFRKMRGMAFTTTMCTGNLRSGTELLCAAEFRHNTEKRKRGLWYYWIDLVFVMGTILGVFLCRQFAERAVWFCVVTLAGAVGFIEMEKRSGEV